MCGPGFAARRREDCHRPLASSAMVGLLISGSAKASIPPSHEIAPRRPPHEPHLRKVLTSGGTEAQAKHSSRPSAITLTYSRPYPCRSGSERSPTRVVSHPLGSPLRTENFIRFHSTNSQPGATTNDDTKKACSRNTLPKRATLPSRPSRRTFPALFSRLVEDEMPRPIATSMMVGSLNPKAVEERIVADLKLREFDR
jgi:hypothetical protein